MYKSLFKIYIDFLFFRYIHPDFRCILVLDEKKLKDADPPLLNRFEKQRMTINDILSKDEKELVKQLEEWT